jgi:hypothetical protein
MRKSLIHLILLVASFTVGHAQSGGPDGSVLPRSEVDRIIKKMTENELAFREALTNYVFNRSATIQTIGMGGQVTGTYRRDSFLTFTSDGQRFERITFFPMPTLRELSITPEDLEDLSGVNPFALDPSTISQYNLKYLGKEKIDELTLHVFDVEPKVIPNPARSKQRVFSGRIWVDDQDLMIVKSKGKGLPETKNNKYPVVETWRENIDGKFWFPAFSIADDVLEFERSSVRLRMRVRYTDYKQGRTDVRILDDEEPVDEPPPARKP